MNSSLNAGQAEFDDIHQQQWLAQNGLDATAEVIAITDTGTLINMNPLVRLTLKVQPAMIAADFETSGQATVSAKAIPRVGDTIKLKYNPANPTQFVVVRS